MEGSISPRINGHKIELLDRKILNIQGIKDVHSFNEDTVILETEMGLLTIEGEDLHINNLNVEQSSLNITGRISSFAYSDNMDFKSKGNSFLGKMFR
ncbi:sporulation protein YabP [Garciella nitratireducens]|uniref:Sporulation protein YabP n=1 Tax=Garciella nitratireducens DSM 15102 TaxID=1121911 RepID=A0A1T4L5K6_9FIRM|nr:sporulation protein YabP [Garciella nitratireducens]SJZ49831.1 sporulation protein YabP [Garciella nitratireducens DSM 15102]